MPKVSSGGLHTHPVMWYHIPHEQRDTTVGLQKPKNFHPLNLHFSGRIALVMVCFFWSILPATYLLSFLFSVPLTGFTRMSIINIITGIIPVFNYLHTSVRNTSHDINQFRSVLKSFLLINSFYSLEEYFAWNFIRDLGSV